MQVELRRWSGEYRSFRQAATWHCLWRDWGLLSDRPRLLLGSSDPEPRRRCFPPADERRCMARWGILLTRSSYQRCTGESSFIMPMEVVRLTWRSAAPHPMVGVSHRGRMIGLGASRSLRLMALRVLCRPCEPDAWLPKERLDYRRARPRLSSWCSEPPPAQVPSALRPAWLQLLPDNLSDVSCLVQECLGTDQEGRQDCCGSPGVFVPQHKRHRTIARAIQDRQLPTGSTDGGPGASLSRLRQPAAVPSANGVEDLSLSHPHFCSCC
jgi:hypothetical protein